MDNLGWFEAISDSAVLLDKAGRIINWNAGATHLFGYTRKEVIGRSINFIYDRNYPFPKLIQEISGDHKKWQEDTNFVRKNGIRGYCKSLLSTFDLGEHNKVLALLVHHNLTHYKKTDEERDKIFKTYQLKLQQAMDDFWGASDLLVSMANSIDRLQEKLNESELRFHLLAENTTDIISRHAPDGTYLYASPACRTMTGYEPEDLMGRNIFKMIHHDDLGKLKKTFMRRHHDASQKTIVYRVKRKEGEFRWFESNIRFIGGIDSRRISELQLATRDVTDRVLDKRARSRSQQLAHVFRLSTMEEMASGMAHEISQPLAAILNYTRGCIRYLENDDHDRDQLKSVMEKAAAQAERAGEIIQRLKNFFCKGQLVKTPCKINNLIRETIGLMKNELTISKTKVDQDLDKNIPFIFIDKIQIQQVILNLVQNAIEAMIESQVKEKRINIETRTVNTEMIEVTISDTGIGFTKETINKVFMPFFTTKAHGRGMGLAICRSIVEAHGGQFTINPNSNGHSWIRFSLPISI